MNYPDRTVRAARIAAGFKNQTEAAFRASEISGRHISQRQWSKWERNPDILTATGYTLILICATCRCGIDALTPAVATFPRFDEQPVGQ